MTDSTNPLGHPQHSAPADPMGGQSDDSSIPTSAGSKRPNRNVFIAGAAIAVVLVIALVVFVVTRGGSGVSAEAYAPESYVQKTHDEKGNPEPCSIPPQTLQNLQVTGMSPGFNSKYQIRFCDGSLPKVKVTNDKGEERNQSVRFSVSFLPQKLIDSDNGIKNTLGRFEPLSAPGLSNGWEVHQGPSDAGLEYCSYYWPTDKGRVGMYLGAGGNCTQPSPQLIEVMKFVETY